MSYLPGVPNMGPAPIGPTIKVPSSVSVGKPSGIAAVAHGAGKPGNTQQLGSVVGKTGKGLTGIGGGNQAAHALNHYGKAPPPGISGMTGGSTVKPISEAGAGTRMIKGSGGGIRPHIRQGALGPGRMGAAGPSDSNYSQTSEDSE